MLIFCLIFGHLSFYIPTIIKYFHFWRASKIRISRFLALVHCVPWHLDRLLSVRTSQTLWALGQPQLQAARVLDGVFTGWVQTSTFEPITLTTYPSSSYLFLLSDSCPEQKNIPGAPQIPVVLSV